MKATIEDLKSKHQNPHHFRGENQVGSNKPAGKIQPEFLLQ